MVVGDGQEFLTEAGYLGGYVLYLLLDRRDPFQRVRLRDVQGSHIVPRPEHEATSREDGSHGEEYALSVEE